MANTQDDILPHCFDFVVNHVFLPPQLPQHAEDHTDEGNAVLLQLLLHCADAYAQQPATGNIANSQWYQAVKILKSFVSFENKTLFSATMFASAVTGLKNSDSICVHIAAQNAGLFLRRTGDWVLVASFEASPISTSVAGTAGKLLVSYPGSAFIIPWSVMSDSTFLPQLAECVEKLKRETLAAAIVRTTQAGQSLPEERESAHPKFVTEMLTGILRAVGQVAQIHRFTKRVSDEVLWDATGAPWRRSPLWLVVRVSLQLILGVEEYKSFLVYFMSDLLTRATRRRILGHRLFIMNSKVSRRVYKLQERLPRFVLDAAQTAGNRAYLQVEKEWVEVQGNVQPFHWNPESLNYMDDTVIGMPGCREYMREFKDIQSQNPAECFVPHEVVRDRGTSDAMPELPTVKEAEDRRDLMLADFEKWVMEKLSSLAGGLMSSTLTSDKLGAGIINYIAIATVAYQGNPEKNSIMLLTTMELWVALDRLTLLRCPLLAEYPPEFNESFLAALLLPQEQQRTRLSHIEMYIKARRLGALESSPSLFSNEITDTTFSVRYFQDTPSLQKLREDIVGAAEVARSRKKAELVEMKKEYDGLRAAAETLRCGYYTHWAQGWTRHDRGCQKCMLTKKADEMQIEVDEWPLPEEPLAEAALIFELRCPSAFAIWRATTFRILIDLCVKEKPKLSRSRYDTCANYSGLRGFYKSDRDAWEYEIKYTSATQSHLSTHYRYRRISTTGDDIFLCCPLRFGLYDTRSSIWTSDKLPAMDIRHLCTFKLPDGPYQNLQYTIKNTSHTANDVLARQNECPPELPLREYIAFGLLRSGSRLQWFNMLREIRCRTLTFRTVAVRMLFLQAAWQVGRLANDANERESHVEPGLEIFGREMIHELGVMLRDVEANWREVVTVQTMIVLASQIVARTRSPTTRSSAVGFLGEARRVCLAWARKLAGHLSESEPGEVQELQMRIVHIAATCRMTFDVEPCWLWDILRAGEDVSVLVECATMIHANVHTDARAAGSGTSATVTEASAEMTETRAILERDMRIAYAVEDRLRHLITNSDLGLDLRPIWSSYEPGSCWLAMESPNDRWVYTHTKGSPENESRMVHYNLISGELLVGGIPLGRLPESYTTHATYQELMEKKLLDVLPSSMPGMVFQTKKPIGGCNVAFGLHGQELVIRTVRESDGVMRQLIPRSKLANDFPSSIVSDHVFWLHLSTSSGIPNDHNSTEIRIDLCAQSTPWTPNAYRYISQTNHRSEARLHLDPYQNLIDVRSATATMIADVLAPLENPRFIVVSYKHDGDLVRVTLPRLKLDFSINAASKLECKQFRGMVVDSNQHIGAFVGLQNFLVVRLDGTPLTRCVFVPYGTVSCKQQDSHTIVDINTETLDKVKYHYYTIDPILGRLTGNGSLTSHLYKIYLHAVTSHCHPDPLTRRTGTEEALAGLRSAATKSVLTLREDSEEAKLFQLIAALTPGRQYFPVHLSCRQYVRWSSELPPLAQHEEFSKGVKEITDYVGLLDMFGESERSTHSGPRRDDAAIETKCFLSKRAAIRNAVFLTEQFGGSMVSETEDRTYASRDLLSDSLGEAKVFYVATLVNRYTEGGLCVHPNLLEVFETLGEITGVQSAPDAEAPRLRLGYDHKWLDPGLEKEWLDLYNILRGSTGSIKKYSCMFFLSTLAYGGKVDLKLIATLLAFTTNPAFRQIEPPNNASYDLQHGYEPNIETLSKVIGSHVVDFCESTESKLDRIGSETQQQTQERRTERFKQNKLAQIAALADEIKSMWPCEQPVIGGLNDPRDYPLLHVPKVFESLILWFDRWNRNSHFRRHILEVQQVLDATSTELDPVFQYHHFGPCTYTATQKIRTTIRLSDLLKRYPPALPARPDSLMEDIVQQRSDTHFGSRHEGLHGLVRDFRVSHSMFRQSYAKGLEGSLEALQFEETPSHSADTGRDLLQKLIDLLKTSEDYMSEIFEAIAAQLGPVHQSGSTMAYEAGLWPRVSPALLLQHLAASDSKLLSSEWRIVIVTFGIAITMVQRLRRLLRLLGRCTSGNPSADFQKELDNRGHQGWDPLLHPDWILIEIENDFLIRNVQSEIASSMIAPSENRNSIIQLCMGEGKTSVIVPIVAAFLADGTKLVRVVVLKPLLGQMFQTLRQKLGGLVNRRIFFLPFSRRTRLEKKDAERVQWLYEECMRNNGILLVQPEHILSFKLVGLERLFNSEHGGRGGTAGVSSNKDIAEVARLLVSTQRWLDQNSRDILDESDEVLNVRHELIYTVGHPTPVENHPDRWLIIQNIFGLIQSHFQGLQEVNTQEFEVERHGEAKRFGSIRILNLDAGRDLLKAIGEKIIKDQVLTISFGHFPVDKQELAVRFITDINLTRQDAGPLLEYVAEKEVSSNILYLLRGLIAHGIILFALKEKRWKVDYGLDPTRPLLMAVPYCAKDVPAGKAEFSHPDVALTFTCLSYYYGGLSQPQLKTCFRKLYKSGNPALEYENWIKGATLPEPYLHRLEGINIDDRKEWNEVIYPTFRYNKAVIDSYLSGVVFPKEAREFPHKLSTSGWDLAATKAHPTTGFSGTNDNRYLLPLSIKQYDRRAQLSTNARVLSYLLQCENNYTPISATTTNERMGVEQLLEMLASHSGGLQSKVLLDVGAQVLELRNEEVAQKWLNLVADDLAQAAVYFDDGGELMVLTRDGNKEPLRASAYEENLRDCLVYLDEAHTRGTDLKFPLGSRAAVTLGPNLTKDRLVQACMRMRKLGHGHSVTFYGPPEVDRKIMRIAQDANRERIEVRDVLFWSMEVTVASTVKIAPIWVQQGITYLKHLKAWSDIGIGFPEALLEKEMKTIEEQYGFTAGADKTISYYAGLGIASGDLDRILETYKGFGVANPHRTGMQEEQVREVAHEMERQAEIQRPPRVRGAKPHLAKEVRQFIKSGRLQQSAEFLPAFSVLERTSASVHLQSNTFSRRLLATSDFCEVIETGPGETNTTDDFLRPVNWIVSSTVDPSILLILSPFEVNKLLPQFRQSPQVRLHMYSPRTTLAAPSYESLDFCPTLPLPYAWKPDIILVDQLNIFAGQLYFRNYEAYKRVCGFLGLYTGELTAAAEALIHRGRFVEKEDRQTFAMSQGSPFAKSPIPLLRALVGLRQKGQSTMTTHMGRVILGAPLEEEDINMPDSGEDIEAAGLGDDTQAGDSEDDTEDDTEDSEDGI